MHTYVSFTPRQVPRLMARWDDALLANTGPVPVAPPSEAPTMPPELPTPILPPIDPPPPLEHPIPINDPPVNPPAEY